MYEVKDAQEVKDQHIKDAAYQAWVLDKCGVQLDGVYVVYHYDDTIDPFEPVDVTEDAIEFAHVVDENIERLDKLKSEKIEVMQSMGEQCHSPYDCWYCDYCKSLENSELEQVNNVLWEQDSKKQKQAGKIFHTYDAK